MLNGEQIEFFDTKGYLVIPDVIPSELLSRLDKSTKRFVEFDRTSSESAINNSSRIAAKIKNDRLLVFRVNELFLEPDSVFLELLGLSGIQEVVESLTGNNFITTYESLLIKSKEYDEPINWHRDMIHDRKYRVITFGVYLDKSVKNSGALKVIPGSQNSADDVCSFEEQVENGIVEPVQLELNPGDILIHDVMTVHSSDIPQDEKYRRTIYFEFRPVIQAKPNPGFPGEWIEIRKSLQELACKRSKVINEQSAEVSKESYSDAERSLISKMYSIQAKVEPGQYCFKPPPK